MAGFNYTMNLDGLHDEHHQHMTNVMDTWKSGMQKMVQDQKQLKDAIERLEQENQELKMQNNQLERQIQSRGPPPATYGGGNVGGIVGAQTGSSKFNLMKQIAIHSAPVHSVTMSKDSEVIATASWDQTSKLYELSTGRVVRTLGEGVEHDSKMNGLYAVAFAKTQDDIMGCTSCDKSVYLWNHQTGALLSKLTGHTNEVNGIDFHTTQQVMATASDDKTVVIWDFQEAIQLRTLDKHTQAVYGCVFLGQENQYFVATCCFDRNTRVFDMRDKSVVACLQVHEDDVIGIDYSSPKQLLATGSDDGKICIWDTRQWRLQKTIDTKLVNPADENEVKRVAFSPNGNLLAAACSSNKVLVYDIENDGTLVDVLATHNDCVFDVCWGLNPHSNKKRLVSASHDHTCCFWEEA